MRKMTIAVVSILAILVLLAVSYFVMRSQGFFRPAVYDTVAPQLPELQRPAILVFSKTNGFIHREAIPAAEALFQSLAEKNGWSIYVTDNGAVHNSDDLARFDTIIWNNVSGDVLTLPQREAFKSYIESGGGWVGIHGSGGDPSYDWDWYPQTLIKAQFIGHPAGPGGAQFQEATIHIEADDDPIVSHLPTQWERVDEWYSFAESPRGKGVQILATLDASTYSPRFFGRNISMGKDHPIIWKHCLDKGRVFYSALGHSEESYQEPEHIEMLERATAWAAGLEGSHCEIALSTDTQASSPGIR